MPIRLSEAQSQFVGAIVAVIFGLGLFVAGGRLIVYDHMLAKPVRVSGLIINSGQTRSSHGGNVSFVRYQFVDQFGKARVGVSSGYSGRDGEHILIEYVSHPRRLH